MAQKPRSFRIRVNRGRGDLTYIRESGGVGHLLKTVGSIASVPFSGFAYIVVLPFGFFVVLAATVVNLAIQGSAAVAGKSMTFEWRPVEAYLEGRKRKKEKSESKKDAKK